MVTMYRTSANIASVKPVRAGREAGWATAIFKTGANDGKFHKVKIELEALNLIVPGLKARNTPLLL